MIWRNGQAQAAWDLKSSFPGSMMNEPEVTLLNTINIDTCYSQPHDIEILQSAYSLCISGLPEKLGFL